MIIYQIRFPEDEKITFEKIAREKFNLPEFYECRGVITYLPEVKEVGLTKDQYMQFYNDRLSTFVPHNSYKINPKIGDYCGRFARCDIVIINTKPEELNK